MGNWGWNHMGSGMGWWGFGFGGFFMILFWVVIIALVVQLMRWIRGSSARTGQPSGNSALDTLKERYARGEIGREEYQQKKRDVE
ncbi:MAG: SHOCT domain-containing protein [Sulfuricaulis sp.]